jgi:hypothetical protein
MANYEFDQMAATLAVVEQNSTAKCIFLCMSEDVCRKYGKGKMDQWKEVALSSRD